MGGCLRWLLSWGSWGLIIEVDAAGCGGHPPHSPLDQLHPICAACAPALATQLGPKSALLLTSMPPPPTSIAL